MAISEVGLTAASLMAVALVRALAEGALLREILEGAMITISKGRG